MKWWFIVLETHFQFRTEREANAGLCSCNEQNREPAIGGSERNHATLISLPLIRSLNLNILYLSLCIVRFYVVICHFEYKIMSGFF